MTALALRLKIVVPRIAIIECLVCMGLISCMSSDSIAGKVLSSRVLVWFGNLTGYFFLFHGAINFALRTFLQPYIGNLYPWLFFISFAISLTLSMFAERYYNYQRSSMIVVK